MKKKYLSIIVMVCLIAFLAVGCTSSTGTDLVNALVKSADIKSFDSSSEVKFNLKYNNFPDYDESISLLNDVFSNISATITQTTDLTNMNNKALATVKLNGISADFEAYTTEDTAWIKLPVFSKYLKYDQAKLNGFQNKEEFLTYQKQMPILLIDFAKKYIQNYKFNLDNIQNNGSVTIQTPNGTKSVKEIEVILDDAECKEFIKYGAKELLGSEDFRNLIIDVIKLVDEEGDLVNEELKKELKDSLDYAREGIDTYYDEAMEIFEILNNGLVVKLYIDNNGYIIKDDISLSFRVKQDNSYYYDLENQEEEEEQSIDFTINIKDDYWNINKAVKIDYPIFNDENTISLEEGNVVSVKTIVDEYKEEKKRERISVFYLDSEFCQIRGDYDYMNFPPYSKNNTSYIPARYISAAVGAEVTGDGKTVTFTKGDDTLVLYVNSSKAIFNGNVITNSLNTELVDGTTMVPVKLVTQNFGAKLEWDEYRESITIEMPE